MDLLLPPDFKEFLKLLKEHDVHYLLIGGYAVDYHGYLPATEDLDIWVAIHPENAQKLVSVLKTFGFDNPALAPELFLQNRKSFAWDSLPCGWKLPRPFQGSNLTNVIRHESWTNWMALKST